MSKPKVSVITITYNHEKYIRQTIESVISQKTDFNIELIIADDYSTDKTAEIVREIEKTYPSKVNAILRTKNIGAQKNFKDAINKAKGDYIALCEGDDYWCDPYKLQKQVDFLEKNKDYAFCFHPVKVIYENKEKIDDTFPDKKDNFTILELIQKNYIQTNSVMYRKQDYSKLPVDIMPLDWYLHLYHAQFGKIGFISDVMAVYRRHSDGIWWDAQHDIEKLWTRYGLMQVAMYVRLLDIYGKNQTYAYYINAGINYMLGKFLETDEKSRTALFRQVMDKFPELAIAYITEQLHTVQNLFGEREALRYELERTNNKITNKAKKRLRMMSRNFKKKRGTLETK